MIKLLIIIQFYLISNMKILFFSIPVIVFLIFFIFKMNIGFNMTNSMPIGFYLILNKNSFNKNDFVSLCPNEKYLDLFTKRHYISKNISNVCYKKYPPFIKKIIATEGDEIEVVDDVVFLNKNILQKSILFNKDRFGRPLPRLPNGFKKRLLKNEYFVFGDGVSRSLDSRYIGLISSSNINGVAYLLYGMKK